VRRAKKERERERRISWSFLRARTSRQKCASLINGFSVGGFDRYCKKVKTYMSMGGRCASRCIASCNAKKEGIYNGRCSWRRVTSDYAE